MLTHRINNILLHFKKVSKHPFFDVNDNRCGRMRKPLWEQILSIEADVAGTDKYLTLILRIETTCRDPYARWKSAS
jgi:hypothetical protein